MIDDREICMDVGASGGRWDLVLERSLSQSRGLAALRVLATWGVPTVNTHAVAQVCNDKLATTCALRDAGVPIPRTLIAFSEHAAMCAVSDLGYPLVLKPVAGSWGRLIARINDGDAAEALFEHRATLGSPEHSIFYLQEHIDKRGRDIRAFVVGGETICAVYRESEHWITNTARGARTSDCPVTAALDALCVRAAAAVGGGALAVDVLERDGGMLVCEVNATMEFRNSIDVTGVDIPGKVADFAFAVARGQRVLAGAT